MQCPVAIIGSGPAGLTAALYAARSGMSPVVISGNMQGGQLLYTHKIENFPAFNGSGSDLVDTIKKQLEELNVKVISDIVTGVDFSNTPFQLRLMSGDILTAKSVIVASGASPRWLGIEGENRFKGKGISVCATCDGFFYKGKEVAVIGGGNTALYESLFLSGFVKKVILFVRSEHLNGEKKLIDEVLKNPKIEVLFSVNVLSFEGEEKLESLSYQIKNGKIIRKEIDGVFVAVGTKPNSEIFRKYLSCDEQGYIITDCTTKETNVKGIFASGDVQERDYRQAVVACASGTVAALSSERYLLK